MCLLEEDMMGRFGVGINRQTLGVGLLGAILLLIVVALATGTATGQTDDCTNTATLGLAPDGSAFEIDTNANLKVDTSGCIDWLANGTGSSFRSGVLAKNDKASGSGDDSFGQGTAEDNPNPTIVTGSIPPNKSDLKAFGVFTEDTFLELFWSRVQNPSGTTNMDFELNQVFCDGTPAKCAQNGTSKNPKFVTPKRTSGDKLITYDLSKGGTVPAISIRTWNGSAWGPATVITGGADPDALGSINTSTIPANETGGATGGLTTALGSQDPFTFGEAAISFEALFGPGACGSFGSAYLKSRSSDSFTSEIKDFVEPEPVNISNCPAGLTTTATTPVTIGSPISDTAHLDTDGTDPTGTITFHLFRDDQCQNEIDTGLSPVAVDGDGDYNSGDYTPTAPGNYFWTATYSGDDTHDPVSTACGDPGETSVVNKGPSSLNTAQNFLPNDSATITGAGTLGGSVTFKLYPSLADCTADTNSVYGPDTRPVSGTGSVTVSTQNTTFLINAANAGDYFWGVSYTGDDSHNGVSRSCHENSDHTITNGGTVNSS
jgi:hypothetical protein